MCEHGKYDPDQSIVLGSSVVLRVARRERRSIIKGPNTRHWSKRDIRSSALPLRRRQCHDTHGQQELEATATAEMYLLIR